MFSNQKGSSLVQAVIGVGLVGATGVVLMKQSDLGNSTVRLNRQQLGKISLEKSISTLLGDPEVCKVNFSTVNFPDLPSDGPLSITDPLKNLDGDAIFKVDEIYEQGLLKIKSITLSDFKVINGEYGISNLKVVMERRGKEKNNLGVKEQLSNIEIMSRSSGGSLITCSSVSAASSVWQNSINGIHYSSGNVGIGNDPKALLHVQGGNTSEAVNPDILTSSNSLIVVENVNDFSTANANIGLNVSNKEASSSILFSDNENEGTSVPWDGIIGYSHDKGIMSLRQSQAQDFNFFIEPDGQVRMGYDAANPPTDSRAEQFTLDVNARTGVAGGSSIRVTGNETVNGQGRARIVLESGHGSRWAISAPGVNSVVNNGGFVISHRSAGTYIFQINKDNDTSITPEEANGRHFTVERDGQVRIGYDFENLPTDASDPTSPQFALDVLAISDVGGGSGMRIRGNEITDGRGRSRLVFESGHGSRWALSAPGVNSTANKGGFNLTHRNVGKHIMQVTEDNRISFHDTTPSTPGIAAGYTYEFNGSVDMTQNLRVNGNAIINGSLTNPSDKRLKKDIQPIKSPLDKLRKLKAVEYFWKPELKRSPNLQYGFVAQEVKDVFPHLVLTDSETNLLSVNYIGLIAPMVGAIMELETDLKNRDHQIEKLTNKVDQQENRIKKLEEKLNYLLSTHNND